MSARVPESCTTVDWIELQIGVPVVFTLAFVAGLYFLIKFIYAYYTNAVTVWWKMFYVSVCMMSLISLDTIFYAITFTFSCTDAETFGILWTYAAGLHSLQYMILLLFLFYRVYFVFGGTAFALRPLHWYLFLSIWIALILCESLLNIFGFSAILFVLCALMIVAMLCYIFGLFIQRLWQISKQASERQDNQLESEILDVATKSFLLTISLILSLVLFMITVVVSSLVFPGSMHTEALMTFVLVLDLSSNFYSILLAFVYFDGFYRKICGKCHGQCLICCAKKVKKQMQRIASNSEIPATPGGSVTSVSI